MTLLAAGAWNDRANQRLGSKTAEKYFNSNSNNRLVFVQRISHISIKYALFQDYKFIRFCDNLVFLLLIFASWHIVSSWSSFLLTYLHLTFNNSYHCMCADAPLRNCSLTYHCFWTWSIAESAFVTTAEHERHSTRWLIAITARCERRRIQLVGQHGVYSTAKWTEIKRVLIGVTLSCACLGTARDVTAAFSWCPAPRARLHAERLPARRRKLSVATGSLLQRRAGGFLASLWQPDDVMTLSHWAAALLASPATTSLRYWQSPH